MHSFGCAGRAGRARGAGSGQGKGEGLCWARGRTGLFSSLIGEEGVEGVPEGVIYKTMGLPAWRLGERDAGFLTGHPSPWHLAPGNRSGFPSPSWSGDGKFPAGSNFTLSSGHEDEEGSQGPPPMGGAIH